MIFASHKVQASKRLVLAGIARSGPFFGSYDCLGLSPVFDYPEARASAGKGTKPLEKQKMWRKMCSTELNRALGCGRDPKVMR